jgi:hypothetical protein
MNRVNTAAMAFCLLAVLPRAASAQNSEYGPQGGVREFSISGTGSNDRNFNSGNFGVRLLILVGI